MITPKKRILIADDEEKILFGISLALKMKGYETTTARDGEEALNMILNHNFENNRFDLVICDIQMPKISGEELINKLKTLKINLPFLVITGFGNKEILIRLIRLGCRDFIDKPFEANEIEERVEMILNETQNETLENKRKEHLTMIGEKALSLAHDIRNILGGTRSYAYIISEKLKKSDPIDEDIAKLIDTTDLASEVCNQVLKIRKNDTSLLQDIIDIKVLIEKSSELLRTIASSAVDIRLDLDSSPLWLKANGGRIQQALINLGINSIQAMPDGGKILLKAALSGSCLCISFSDTGCGISPENISKIFSASFSTKKNGNAIGLATVKRIMEEHEGWIDVSSEPGKGTEFKLFFPVERQSRNDDPAREKATIGKGRDGP